MARKKEPGAETERKTRKKSRPEAGREIDGEYWYIDPSRVKPEQEIREAALRYPEEGEKDLNRGHRSRVRERFRAEEGFDSFQDHEILELLLTYGSPRKDTKALAKKLLETFGTLKCVFEAPPRQLMQVEGIGEIQATLISMMLPMTRVIRKCEMTSPRQIGNRKELENYCSGILMGKRIEEFWVICVNAQCRILGQRMISAGSLSEVSAYPRLVMETVLTYNAHSVFFCHNHPGGTCAPSSEDIATTLQLQRLLGGIDVMVLDHLIIAGADSYSMAQHGDIEFGARGRR